jgi:hypothetical protein
VVRWHRAGFRLFWKWKSRSRTPAKDDVSPEVKQLLRRMAEANVTWGAPRIHGELLTLGIDISERSVSRFMPKRERKPPSQTSRTFLDNHLGSLASIDLFTVPAPRSPWQNPLAERLGGSVRRECLNRAIVLGERHLHAILRSYFAYYHKSRTHLSLCKDAPEPRAVQSPSIGDVVELPEVGGLHHRYERRAA